MNINSIQTSEVMPVILRSPERNNAKVDAGKGPSPEPSTSVLPGSSGPTNDAQSPMIQAQTLITHINYAKEQLDKILVEFPPFFPPGSYQRIDLIKGIRGIQVEVEKSSIQSDLKKEISSSKLSEDATDSEISAALARLFSLRDELSKGFPMTVESPKPGTLVNVKV
jgi:hypothetical protein